MVTYLLSGLGTVVCTSVQEQACGFVPSIMNLQVLTLMLISKVCLYRLIVGLGDSFGIGYSWPLLLRL